MRHFPDELHKVVASALKHNITLKILDSADYNNRIEVETGIAMANALKSNRGLQSF